MQRADGYQVTTVWNNAANGTIRCFFSEHDMATTLPNLYKAKTPQCTKSVFG
jgi:hypothetical protein